MYENQYQIWRKKAGDGQQMSFMMLAFFLKLLQMIAFAKLLQKLTLNYHTITTFPEYEIYHTSAPASGVDEGLRLPLYRVCSVDNARPIVLFDPTQGKEVIPERDANPFICR